MIKLYGFGAGFELSDVSPFVMKVDLLLKVSKLEYQTIVQSSNLGKAPKAKLPFIDDAGVIVADSLFIIDHLKTKYAIDLDQWLSAEQVALGQLFTQSLEGNLYWCVVHSRWLQDDTWPILRDNLFASVPLPLRGMVASLIRNKVKKQLYAQGIGRHSPQEILDIAERSLSSLSTLLGDQRYFFGEQISNFDLTAYAIISAAGMSNIDNPTSRKTAEFDNLIQYAKRIKAQYYS